MTKMRFASKNRSDGSVYHYPINEYSKKPEKEITIHKLQDSSKNIEAEAKRIAYKFLDDYLEQVRNGKVNIDWIRDYINKTRMNIDDKLWMQCTKDLRYEQNDYNKMTNLVKIYLEKGKTESEIVNDNYLKEYRDRMVTYATLNVIHHYIDTQVYHSIVKQKGE